MKTLFPAVQFRRLAVLGAMAIFGLATLTMAQADANLEPLPIKLPKARFEGTPKNLPKVHLDPANTGKPRDPFLAPKGCKNMAAGKTATSSDSNPIIGDLTLITDGDKEAQDGSFVELAEGKQWVQIDLGTVVDIAAVVIWHRHDDIRVYRDVIVQTADDADFITNVQTLFNNDQSNELGLGVGKDYEYVETNGGKLVDGKGTKARYVRLYSKGSTANAQNDYTEVEVWGRPAK